MTNEELFDAYRQVVSQRDQLVAAGDDLWNDMTEFRYVPIHCERWKALRGVGAEPPLEDWSEC